jgi:dihydropteroate synthase
VLVTGSLYAVAEARDRWTRLLIPKDRRRRVGERTLFSGTTGPVVDNQTFTTYLRSDQAALIDRRLEAIGGHCVYSDADAPGKLVKTVLSGTVSQLRELAAIVATDDLGLGHFARQLEAVLDGPTPDAPFDTDRTAVMGVLNVTPDSFHDGGEYNQPDAAIQRAERMVSTGADIVDVGGESTRPGADPVPVSEEIDRVIPVIESISSLDVPISVDTRKASVAKAALDAGADIVNDVSGLSDPEMRFVVADHNASVVLMHSLSAPVDPDRRGTYDDVEDVLHDLSERVLLAERAGIDREQIIIDPGCGFGKNAAESFDLVDRLPEFRALGCPVMVGHSRKSMFERVGCQSGERLPPTLAVTAMVAERGADVVRVHDVAENAAVVRTVETTNDQLSE